MSQGRIAAWWPTFASDISARTRDPQEYAAPPMRAISLLVLLFACSSPRSVQLADAPPGVQPDAPPDAAPVVIPIKHVVVVVKENHTFDNYFGSFPGADGISMIPTTGG